MIPLSLALIAFAAQEFEWVETRFTRVHLRNGNFIDGQLSEQSSGQLSLRMKSGDFTLKNDQIEWIELVKMRSLNEKPKALPKKPEKAAAAPAAAAGRVTLELGPESIRIREAVAELVRDYRDAAPDHRTAALEALRKAGAPALPVLASMLEDPDESARAAILEILTLLKDPRALPSLVKLLATPLPGLRAELAGLLGLMGDEKAVAPLRPLLKAPQPEVRSRAASSIGVLGGRDDIDDVIALCADPDRSVRGSAAQAALDLGRRLEALGSVCRGLMGLVDRTDSTIRADLVLAIGQTGIKEGVPTLIAMASDSDPRVRTQAVKGLGRFGSVPARTALLQRIVLEQEKDARIQLAVAAGQLKLMDAIDGLIGWLRDDDPDLKAAAASALKILSGQDLGTDHARWSQWAKGARRAR